MTLPEHVPADAGRTVSDAAADAGGGRPEVVRSEERLRAGDARVVEAARARLVRSIETVTRTIEVQVRREVARLEVDPLPEAREVEGSLQPQELVVVLREEEPVVTLRPKPYAYARLTTELVQEDEVVRGKVRVERVALDTDAPSDSPS